MVENGALFASLLFMNSNVNSYNTVYVFMLFYFVLQTLACHSILLILKIFSVFLYNRIFEYLLIIKTSHLLRQGLTPFLFLLLHQLILVQF